MKYSYFYVMCALIFLELVLIAFSLKHRGKVAVRSFIALVALSAAAKIFYSASLIINVPEIKFLVHELKFIGVAFLSVAFYKMYMELFEIPRLASKKHILALMIVPFATVILALTNNYHHLFRISMWVVEKDYGSFVGVESGPLFWAYTAYTYFVYMFCLVIVTRIYLKTHKLYRMQIGIMIYAEVSTFICNFISISGFLFEDFGDATLIIFSGAALFQFYALVLYKPVVMIRMARELAVSELKDIVVTFDYAGHLFDANTAAAEFFSIDPDAETELCEFLSLRLGVTRETLEAGDFTAELDDGWYTMSLKRIADESGALAATALIMSDITEIKLRERELEKMADIDYITGLPNRHAYLRDLSAISADDLPAAVVRINAAVTEIINGERGTGAGDETVTAVARALLTTAGETGICARIEDDDFALLLKNTDAAAAESALAALSESLPEVTLIMGLAFMCTAKENINIVDKIAVDNLNLKKLLSADRGE